MKTFETFMVESPDEKRNLAKEIHDFLAKHGKRDANEPDEWSSPDASGMEAAAHALHHGHKVYHPRSDWGSGGYKPYNDKAGRSLHDSLVKKIEKHL